MIDSIFKWALIIQISFAWKWSMKKGINRNLPVCQTWHLFKSALSFFSFSIEQFMLEGKRITLFVCVNHAIIVVQKTDIPIFWNYHDIWTLKQLRFNEFINYSDESDNSSLNRYRDVSDNVMLMIFRQYIGVKGTFIWYTWYSYNL